MAKDANSIGTWAWRLVLAIGVLVAAIAGPRVYMTVAATPLHQDPESAPSQGTSTPSPGWSEAVDRAREAIRAGLAAQNLPGVSAAVGAGGELVWAEGFGWADIKAQIPVTPQTRFRIGTASTALTSAAVGVLLERDQLRLDDEIQALVPQFPQKSSPVTLRQLMAHVAGVGTDSPGRVPVDVHRCERPVQAVPYFAGDALLFQPGTRYAYSRYGWILVSAAIEAAAGRPFLAFMGEQVFTPLGMTGTGAESAKEENPYGIGEPGEDAPFMTLAHDLILEPMGIVGPRGKPPTAADPAMFYARGWGPEVLPRYGLHVLRARNLSCYAGAMAFLSTPSDLVRFGLAMRDGRLLQPATVQRLQTSQQLTSGEPTGHGLGWDIDSVALAGHPTEAIGRDAESPAGKVVTLLTFPERGLVVAVASNIQDADTRALALQVAEAFADRQDK